MRLIKLTPMTFAGELRVNLDAICYALSSGPEDADGTWLYFGPGDDPLGVRESIDQIAKLGRLSK